MMQKSRLCFGPEIWARRRYAARLAAKRRREERRPLVPIAAWAVLLAAAVVTEWTIDDLRHWYISHPVLAGVVSGGLILAPLVFFTERWVAHREQRRRQQAEDTAQTLWREPAREAIETYMESCFDALTRVRRELERGAREVGREKGDLADLPQLAAERTGWFREFRDLLADLARLTGPVALAVGPVVREYPPLTRFVEPVATSQRLLRQAVPLADDIVAHFYDGAAEQLTSLLTSWETALVDLTHNLRDLDEEDLSVPPELRLS